MLEAFQDRLSEIERLAGSAALAGFTRDFRLTLGPYSDDEVVLVSFDGTEALNELYALELCFFVQTSFQASATMSADTTSDLVGARARLLIHTGMTSRSIHGIISELAIVSVRQDRIVYRARLVPGLWKLSKTTDTRVFQGASVDKIVSEVLKPHGLRCQFRLGKELEGREYCLQYGETDFAFVARILAEEGLAFWFEHDAFEGPGPLDGRTQETLVVGDNETAYVPLAGAALTYRPPADALMKTADDVYSFRAVRSVVTEATTVRRYDFERAAPRMGVVWATPAQPSDKTTFQYGVGDVLASDKAISDATLEDYDPLAHDHETAPPAARAERRLAQLQAPAMIGQGTSLCRRLAPGTTFQIDDAEHAVLGLQLAAVRIIHRGANVLSESDRYVNQFECVPGDVLFRPPPPQPRVVHAVESAVVVGYEGQEIATDAYGRVRVQFQWDRRGNHDGASSCWIRVMQPWSGPGFGFQFVPRIGSEVLVSFLGGDPDRPVVIGCLPNRANRVPFALPAQMTRSGIRTKSSIGGDGYNEISFEDKLGEENIFIKAQKHFTEEIGVDHTTKVAHDRTLQVDGKYSATIAGDLNLTCNANYRDNVTTDRAVATGGSVSVTIGANSTEKITGHRSVEVQGATKARLAGATSTRIEDHAALAVLGSLTVAAGAKEAAPLVIHGHGSVFTSSDETIVLNATKSLSIQCGDTIVKLTPEGIEITGKAVTIKGTDETIVRGKDCLVELADEARVAASATRLFGQSASVEVSTNAYMKGVQVKLNSREGDPPVATDATTTEPTRTLNLKLSDGGYNAYQNRPYEMIVNGVRYSGTTGGDGSVSQDIPESATQAKLLLWEGDPPAGKTQSWNLNIAKAPEASSIDGARSRLANLGYEVGKGKSLDRVTIRSLKAFQRDHDLEETGELDDTTVAKLTEAHGN